LGTISHYKPSQRVVLQTEQIKGSANYNSLYEQKELDFSQILGVVAWDTAQSLAACSVQ